MPERNAEGGQRQHSAADGMAQDSTRGNEEELDEAQRQEEALSHITVLNAIPMGFAPPDVPAAEDQEEVPAEEGSELLFIL